MSLTNTRDIKCNNIYLNFNNDMRDIKDIFSFKSDIESITGLPPATLNTLQELAAAMNNNPDFFNYVNQQLLLKRNINDSYDKNYIDTLINLYYSKSQSDVLLNNKLNLTEIVNYYTKLQSDVLLNNKLNLSEIVNYYTKLQSDVLLNNKLNSTEIANYYTKFITDNLLFQKVSYEDILLYYTKTEMNSLLTNKLNANEILNYYTKIDTNNLLLNYYSKIESDANFYAKSYIDTTLTTINNNVALKLNSTELNNYYTQTQSNSNFYNKSYIDSSLTTINSNVALKANSSDLTNYYNKTQVDTQFSNLINSAPEALNTLKELSDALGNDANYASTIQAQISAKRNISDSYTKTDVDSIFNTNKQTIYTANINFLDAVNLGIDTLTIKGGTYTRLINNVNQALMDLDNSQISITPPLKLYSNLVVDGTATISNMYNKTQVDALISAGSGSNSNAYTKLETDNLLNVKTNTVDFNTLSSTVSNGLTARYTKTESDNLYYNKAAVDLINVTPYVNIFNGGTYTALNINHSYGIRLGIGTNILMTMDVDTGIAMTTSLFVDDNLSVSGVILANGNDLWSNITDLQTAFNNTYTKTQADALLNNKQSTLNSSSLITVNKITATTYSTPGDHSFVDSVGTTRLTMNATTNTFLQRTVAPTFNATGSVQTNSTSEGVEIGRDGVRAVVRISGAFPTLRLENSGTSGTAFGFSIQRNSSSNVTTAMLGTTGYQAWGNSVNTFSLPIVATSISASSTLNVVGASTLGNITVNGTITGTNFTKSLVGLGNVDNTSDLNKPVSTATTTALGLKQNTLIGQSGTGEELLTTNYVKRIFGKAPLSVTTYFDTNAQADARNNNIQIASNLKWYVGSVNVSFSTTFATSTTQTYGGLTIYVKTISITLPTGIFSNAPKIFINQGMGNASTHASIMRIYSIDSTTTSFKIVIQDLANMAAGYDIYYMAIDDTTMGN